MIEEFNNWEDFNKTVKGIVADEFNGFELWEDYNTTGEIFSIGTTPEQNTTNFFLFFD